MGLDNFPKLYPCKKAGTAVVDIDGRIDCKETQLVDGCPYKNQFEKDPMLKDAVPVYGMLGTDCWYRGKWGNYLINTLRDNDPNFDPEFDFYGDLPENENTQGGISETGCIELSMDMQDYAENWAHYVMKTESDPEEQKSLINDWIYASWWLKFVGEYGNGSEVWY